MEIQTNGVNSSINKQADSAKYNTYTFMAFGTFSRPNGVTLAASGIGQNMQAQAQQKKSAMSQPMVKRSAVSSPKTDEEKLEEIFWTSSTLVPTLKSKLQIYNQNNTTIENTNKQWTSLAALSGYTKMSNALSHIK